MVFLESDNQMPPDFVALRTLIRREWLKWFGAIKAQLQ
jgi:hypothetical protein